MLGGKIVNFFDMSINSIFSYQNMDYTKYLHCTACQESGLYCTKHRIEVETYLRKREIRKILRISNQPEKYNHAIKGLLESYGILNPDIKR